MSDESKEILKFTGSDDECTHVLHEKHSIIISSTGCHTKGSSRLTLKNFVDFNWNQCYYRGQLIALHINEQYIAYAFTKPDTIEGLVRVVKRDTNERILIKGFSSSIEDLSFAHTFEMIMLGCVDQSGNLYVYIVQDDTTTPGQLITFPVLIMKGDPSYCFKNKHLLRWCEYIPEEVNNLKKLEYEQLYKGKILALVRGSEVEIWHVGVITNYTSGPIFSNFELNKTLNKDIINKLNNGVIKIDLKDSEVISLSFSPDGSNISIALENGCIYFYQISFDDTSEPPKCVFNWHPEELFLCLRGMVFLDNHKYADGDVELWKYVVTYSSHNEIALWSCETWECLQRVQFQRPYKSKNSMKLTIDITGKYIFLSDIDNNLLYVLEVSVDLVSPNELLKFVSVSEILLQSPMLNMIIINAKIDHNDVNSIQQYHPALYRLNKCTTIIDLFAIQPKSIQEGQLIIPSPDFSIMDEFVKQNKMEPVKMLPVVPSLNVIVGTPNYTQDFTQNNSKVSESSKILEKVNNKQELTSIEVHNLVKEKLRLRGINLDHKTHINPNIHKLKLMNDYNKLGIASPTQFTHAQNPYEISEPIGCSSPSNNEGHHHEKKLPYDFQNVEAQKNNFDQFSSYSNQSGFNGSNMSIGRSPKVESVPIHNEIGNQLDLYSCLQAIHSRLQFLSDNMHINNCINTPELCQVLEPVLMKIVKNSTDQSHKNLQTVLDHQLNASHKKIADIVSSSNTNQIDTEVFTRSLVASLSPTLDQILKDLFMSTVIPKFEQACCSMFKQIDESFTERSLEYQNELKVLLNEEGNINYKLEFAFEKFKGDMKSIIKQTENNILSSQSDMHKQFSSLLREKSLSQIESFMDDSEKITNQFMMLSEFIDHGDYATAFEKALSASNLELVLYVCEKIPPEELFQQSNSLKTPIVLSLIQQLSLDLTYNTEIKYKYLDAAVSSLDYSIDIHKENISLVLIKMDLNMEKFIQQYPFNHYGRKFKMLQLAVKTIISYNNPSST